MGTLRLVATPIGTISDISLRAAKTLLTADIIACEDTRKTGILLAEIKKLFADCVETKKPRLLSYYDQKEVQKAPEIVELLQSGQDVVLVSDAGTPTISDPGFKLVRACIEKGITVTSIPGPSAGLSEMNIWKFSLYTFLGSAIWSTFLTWIGFYFGTKWNSWEPYFRKFQLVIIVLLIVGVLWYINHKLKLIKFGK